MMNHLDASAQRPVAFDAELSRLQTAHPEVEQFTDSMGWLDEPECWPHVSETAQMADGRYECDQVRTYIAGEVVMEFRRSHCNAALRLANVWTLARA